MNDKICPQEFQIKATSFLMVLKYNMQSRYRIQNTEYRLQNKKYEIQKNDTKYKIQDTAGCLLTLMSLGI